MLEALRKRFSQQFADATGAAIAMREDGDWQGRLEAWIQTVCRQYVASYALHDAIFHDPAVYHRCVIGEEPMVKQLAALLAQGRDAGHWAVEEPLSTAACMFHGLHGLVDEAIATGSDTNATARHLSCLYARMVQPDSRI